MTLERGTKMDFKENKNYAFVSYSHADADIVLRCVNELRKSGFNIWTDEFLPYDQTGWDETVDSYIVNENCKRVLYFRSENSLTKENIFRELDLAHGIEKKITIINLFPNKDNDEVHKKLLLKSATYRKFRDIISYKASAIELAEAYSIKRIERELEAALEMNIKPEDISLEENKEGENFQVNHEVSQNQVSAEVSDKPKITDMKEKVETTKIPDKADTTDGKSESPKKISFRVYGQRFELNQADFMSKVYERVLNRNLDQLDLVVSTQQNVAYANQVPESKKVYFRPEKEIIVGQQKVWIGTSYSKSGKFTQIAKLFKVLGLNPKEILEIDNETLPAVKATSANVERVKEKEREREGIQFSLYGKGYVATNQSDYMLMIYEILLKLHPDQLEEITKQQNHVMYEDKQKAESIPYFRGSKVFNIAGHEVRVGTSFDLKSKLRHIVKLFDLLAVPYNEYSSQELQLPIGSGT